MSITRTLSFRALSGSTRALAARPIAPASAPASTASCLASTSKLASLAASRPRYLSRSSRCAAAVSSGETSHIIDSTRQTNSPDGRTPLQVRRDQNASPQDRKSALDEAKERKFRQYEKLLKAKAAEEGASSIEELAAKKKAEREAALSSSLGITPDSQGSETQTEKRDKELAARIRQLAEAEAKRKLASGELTGTGGDKSPIKPLSSIMDLQKLEGESAEAISKLWTGYHSIKKKLSAVIPTETYLRLVETAKRYPQFVLPLPRTIVGAEDGDQAESGVQAGEQKQGYEIQFMEWGFLPSPEPQDGSPRVPSPTTVLFTPLAEYKLRQEFAQPLLVLTHYTDLAHSKGVVLMRGEITSSEELEATPTGVAAAEAAKARGASEEEQQRLMAPVQGGASPGAKPGEKMSEQDAQLLAMTMQRFYLPAKEAGAEDAHASERKQLLKAFHEDKEAFSVQRLCEAAFTF